MNWTQKSNKMLLFTCRNSQQIAFYDASNLTNGDVQVSGRSPSAFNLMHRLPNHLTIHGQNTACRKLVGLQVVNAITRLRHQSEHFAAWLDPWYVLCGSRCRETVADNDTLLVVVWQKSTKWRPSCTTWARARWSGAPWGRLAGMHQDTAAWSVAIDGRGHVFVSDITNMCVQVFSVDGVYIGAILKQGELGLGELLNICWFSNTASLVVSHTNSNYSDSLNEITVINVSKVERDSSARKQQWVRVQTNAKQGTGPGATPSNARVLKPGSHVAKFSPLPDIPIEIILYKTCFI